MCGEVVAKEGMHQNGNGNDLVPDWERTSASILNTKA